MEGSENATNFIKKFDMDCTVLQFYQQFANQIIDYFCQIFIILFGQKMNNY
jgi:hypothetical protein